jgi:hypothetical protein
MFSSQDWRYNREANFLQSTAGCRPTYIEIPAPLLRNGFSHGLLLKRVQSKPPQVILRTNRKTNRWI